VGDDDRGPAGDVGQQFGGESGRGGVVQMGGRLVEQQDRAIGQQGPRHADALAFAARDGSAVGAEASVQAGRQGIEPGAQLGFAQAGCQSWVVGIGVGQA